MDSSMTAALVAALRAGDARRFLRLPAERPFPLEGGAVLHGPRLFEQPTCHWRPATEWGLLAEEASSLLKSFFRQRRGTATGGAR